MDNLIHIVGEELNEWQEQASDTKRYSIFTQHLMLAEKISKHQHLTPRSSMPGDEDGKSFHSAESKLPTSSCANDVAATKADMAFDKHCPSGTVQIVSNRAPLGIQKTRQTSKATSGEWTWRPPVPHRTSSMSTRRGKGKGTRRPDLATFHRRSCQLFSSLDSTLSNATSSTYGSSRSSTSTSPSLTSSITTQATSILDDNVPMTATFPSFNLELQDPRFSSQRADRTSLEYPGLCPRRSSSRLSPKITCTEQIFWTSEASREAEYAKIDASHRGLKGFVKKCLPRQWAWAHGKRRNFHKRVSSTVGASKVLELDDDDSVRRFRISIASATQEAIRSVETHGVSRANTPVPFDSDVTEPRLDLETGYIGKKTKKASSVTKVIAKVRSSEGLARMFRGSARQT